MTRRRSRLNATLLGIAAGLALAVSEIGSTLRYLQTIPAGFQGLPLPANLDWISAWSGTALGLEGLRIPMELLARLALISLGVLIFRTLNPDFRLVPPPPPDAEAGALLRQPVDRRLLAQIARAALLSLWLLGFLGAWLPWGRGKLLGLLLAGPLGLGQLYPHAVIPASVVGLVLLFGGLWLVWGEAGLLRPATGRQQAAGRRALAAAAIAGLALTPFALPLSDWAQEITTRVLQGIGGTDRGAWRAYLVGVLLIYPLALGAAAWTAVSLARWSHFPWERRALAAGGAAAILAWLGVAGLLDLAGSGRFDFGVPLARAAGVPVGPGGRVATITLLPGPAPVLGVTPVVSNQGLAATETSARAVWAYLRWRHFRTVHLFPALMHVCQCEALSWDSDRFLDTTLRSLQYNPHPGFCELLVEKLAHTAATPKARRALAQLQDPPSFHLSPGAAWGIWMLRRRLDPEGAVLSGRLWINGRPAAGTRVGLLDENRWQQFNGPTPALNHRLVVAGATVDPNGAFRFEQIPAGRYFLLVMAPLEGSGPPPAIRAMGSPGPITVHPGMPELRVGDVRLTLISPPSVNRTGSARSPSR